jgi:lysophospholipase L1-like esterase
VEKVLDAAHELYVKAGARNFLILDVPPIDRSSRGAFPSRQCGKLPDGCSVQAMGLTELMAPRYAAWNTLLSAHVSDFASSTPKANVFLFSQHHVLSRIIDGPDVYGLAGEDEIWADELHLTEKTHRVFAAEVFKALFSES